MSDAGIPFLDLVKLDKNDIARTKIKFNQRDKYNDPIDIYLADPQVVNEDWLFWKANTRYFNIGEIAINFVQYSRETWLLTTIKEVVKEYPDVINDTAYEGVERTDFAHLFGRLFVRYTKDSRISVRKASGLIETLIVDQITPNVYEGERFPGYENVRLSFTKLENIIMREKKDWVAALENQKAVYLITDTSNGKMYVGSAYGDNGMLLQRWEEYILNGHGGNAELEKIVNKEGLEYVRKHFQYSILENYNTRVDLEVILSREKWWKDTLCTREYGYNKN